MNLIRRTLALALSVVVVAGFGTTVLADSSININGSFKDENFRTYLKKYDENNNGNLEDSELKKIARIDITSNDRIKDLSGIEKLKYCDTLTIYKGDVVNVDISNCTNLVNVSISYTTTLKSFKASCDLEYLDISYSSIETLDLTRIFYLKGITLVSDEKLTGSLNLTGALFLNEVKILNAPFDSIDFCKACRLGFLQIVRTNVTSLDLSKITGLDFTTNLVISENANLRSLRLPGDIFVLHVSRMKNGKSQYMNGAQMIIIE